MFAVIAVVGLGLVAGAVYVGWERLGAVGLGLAALRTTGLGALVLLLWNPARTVRVSGGPPVVLLDASLSMNASGASWQAALDTARDVAGSDGTILRFGTAVEPFDTSEPRDGISRIEDALATARALGGPIHVITDGELADGSPLLALQAVRANYVLLPRDTLANAALIDVHVPPTVQDDDSVQVTLTIGTWGALPADTGRVEVFDGLRMVASRSIDLPPSPGIGRRQVTIAAGSLPVGDRVLHVAVSAPGDQEARDDVRTRVTSVSELPSVIVLANPADYEGRFLYQELSDIARNSVRGYARVADDRWVSMGSMQVLRDAEIDRVTRNAGLVLQRSMASLPLLRASIPTWRWPAGQDAEGEFFEGDWYLVDELDASPLVAALVGIAWDSLPPLTGLLPLVPSETEWVALSARRSRRGPSRAILLGSDSAGMRRLVTAGTGMWRWAFRGGAEREAYRAILAAGVDWLLGGQGRTRTASLTAVRTTTLGVPAPFTWTSDSIPERVSVTLRGDTGALQRELRFDQTGTAFLDLDPGVYQWSSENVSGSGTVVVESYSPEFHIGPITSSELDAADGSFLSERFVRQRWWLFLLAITAFAAEWGWRLRRGLP